MVKVIIQFSLSTSMVLFYASVVIKDEVENNPIFLYSSHFLMVFTRFRVIVVFNTVVGRDVVGLIPPICSMELLVSNVSIISRLMTKVTQKNYLTYFAFINFIKGNRGHLSLYVLFKRGSEFSLNCLMFITMKPGF